MKLDLPSVRAALRGMFRVWPTGPEDDELLASLDTIHEVTSHFPRHEIEFEQTMRRMTEAMRP